MAAILLALSAPATAQQYPDRAVKLVLPFPPGGAVDVVTRLVAEKMAADLGQPVVIENKAGAGGILATDTVAKAAPDGYTLLITTPNHTINAALNPKLPYDTEKDLTPIGIFAEVPEVLVSFPGAPFEDFRGFVDYAKKNPGKLNYSSAGIGTLPHITMEVLLKQVAHIPYRGAAPAMTDLLAGVVQLKLDTYATSNQHVANGKLRMLAYAARERTPLMPNVPTVAELGLPGYEGILWIGMLAPAGTPKPIVDKLAASATKAVRAPDIVERFRKEGVDAVAASPEAFAAQIKREIPQWRDIGQSAKITIE
jgi:tripartite-type tricarboxylate transporter receptor subunit TctC